MVATSKRNIQRAQTETPAWRKQSEVPSRASLGNDREKRSIQ
jgi:hypothetical protein